ncbi:MAG: hypothetical protein ACT4OK_00625 [Gemmobacter sp.]
MAPSPAAGEPGLQNAAARLRSSRDAQARLLEDRRAKGAADGEAGIDVVQPEALEEAIASATAFSGVTMPDLPLEERAHQVEPGHGPSHAPEKQKLVVLFRLSVDTTARIAKIPRALELGEAYVLKALAKEGRAVLRGLRCGPELNQWTAPARDLLAMPSREMTVGESMTVYVHTQALDAMHEAVGDPWKVVPKATVVGTYLAVIVTSLIEARLAR